MDKVQRWLKEEPWLDQLLRWLLARLGQPRSRDVTRRVKHETIPALYAFDGMSDYRWSLIKALADEEGVLEIQLQRVRPGEPVYENAQLRLRPDVESRLREWLDVPREDPDLAAWRQAVVEAFGPDHPLQSSPIRVPGRAAREVVAALQQLSASYSEGLTLRELSARHFWGDSKFLEGREDWLLNIVGMELSGIVPRPLLLTTYAPAGFTRLLFIENQDTFAQASRCQPADVALIYTGGFRASAGRLTKAALFSFLPGSSPEDFLHRWQEPTLPAYFWGDLDFSGMGILASLRLSIPQLEAWRPAYELMLQHLLDGGGHTPGQSGKELQRDPGSTGCAYADTQLLPALREICRFVDQEWGGFRESGRIRLK